MNKLIGNLSQFCPLHIRFLTSKLIKIFITWAQLVKYPYIIAVGYLFFLLPAQAEVPLLKAEEILIEKQNAGYIIYIKKLPEINSVLLTESQADPSLRKVNYSLRVTEPYPGLEKETRVLNGHILGHPPGSYYLVGSCNPLET